MVLLASATGCGATGTSTAGPVAAGALRVGYLGALTGGTAALGIPAKNGIQLAVDEINASGGVGGRPIELIAVDDKADPATSVAGAQKLVTQDQVVAVLGGPSSATVKASNAVITGAGVPELITIAQDDALVDVKAPNFPLTFRTTEDTSYDLGAITTLLQTRGYKAVCVLADNTAYGEAGLRNIEAVFASRSLSMRAVVRHPAGVTDLGPQALQLRNAGCDSVYLHSLGPESALFLKTVNQLGWKVPVLAGRGLAAKSFLALAGVTADGLIIPGVVDPAKPSGKAFVAAYDKRFGPGDDPAHVYAALGYDSMKLLAAGLAQSGGAGGTRLAAALETLSISDAASGRAGSTLSFSTNRHQAPGRDYLVFYEIRGGTFRFLTSDVESGR